MRSRHGACGALAALLTLLVLSVPSSSRAGGVGVSVPAPSPDSLNEVQQACCDSFNLYRLKRRDFPVPNTDLEFLWSDTYRSRYSQPLVVDTTVTNDLDRLGLLLGWNPDNPYSLNASDVQLLYDYFNWPGRARPDVYDETEQASHHYLLADTLAGGTPYPEADQNHVDSYLYAPNTGWAGWPEVGYPADIGDGGKSTNAYRDYGLTNSDFVSRIEDISSLHPALPDSIYHLNSMMMPGPRRYLIGSTEWTVAGGRPNWMWDHEFQHVLNGLQNPLREFWSSMAEAVGGELPDPPIYDAPYTWGLLYPGFYQAWRSFGSYLVSNFRNNTQEITDDLVYRWAHGTGANKDLADLSLRLRNGECAECQSLPYMASDTTAIGRLGLVMHNWRVASWANDYDLADHQYGFNQAFDFEPWRDVGMFQGVDALYTNDNIAIPPQFVLSAALRMRDTVYRQRPAIHGSPARPLALGMLGAEYVVLRADPGLAGTSQDLVVRVGADGITLSTETPDGCQTVVTSDGEMFASVITYSHDDTALYRHPEWLVGVTTKRILADSLRGELEFLIPGYGTQVKAAVVVVSLQDGPHGYNSVDENAAGGFPIHVSAELAVAPYPSANPQLVQATPSSWDDWPSWSPSADELMFHALIPGISSFEQIWRKRLDGSPATRLAASPSNQYAPDWSPRGDYVAYEQGGGGQSDIYVKNALTSDPAVRASFQTGYAHSPSFRPNGEGLAYILDPPGTTQPMELRLLNLAYGAPFYDELLATLPPLDDVHPLRWSPDGDSLYFIQHDSLYVAWIFGGWQPRLNLTGGRRTKAVDFGNDGVRLVYERPDSVTYEFLCSALGCGCIPNFYTIIEPVSLLAVRTLASGAWEPRFASGSHFPRFSPDATRVAYSNDFGHPGDRDLWWGAITYDHAPHFSGLASDYYATACVPFAILLNASDPDGQNVTYSVALKPVGSELDGNVFRWSYPYVGDYSVVLRARDGTGAVDNRVVKIHVTDGGYCEGELIAQGGTPDGWTTEGTVLGPAAAGTTTDVRRLPAPLQTLSGKGAVRFIARGSASALLDQVKLVTVDHASGTSVYPVAGGFVAASRIPATTITNGLGKDITGAIADGYDAQPGEVLSVDLGDKSAGRLVIEARGRNGGATASTEGILVQCPAAGTWQTLRQVFPRGEYDEFVIDSVGGTVRLAFQGAHTIRFAGRLVARSEAPRCRCCRSLPHGSPASEMSRRRSGAPTEPVPP